MAKKVFISYCHEQGNWVWKNLVPCLNYGGVKVYIDRERFEAGKDIFKQMDEWQDKADINIVVLSPGYLASPYCIREMNRAIDKDPQFTQQKIIPISLKTCKLPDRLTQNAPLLVNLQNDKDSEECDKLFHACKASLGTSAPDWIKARNKIIRYLTKFDSVNLLIKCQRNEPYWRQLIKHLQEEHFKQLGVVDLKSGSTALLRNLIEEILNKCGMPIEVPKRHGEDLRLFDKIIKKRKNKTFLCLANFNLINKQKYKIDFLGAMEHLIVERKLVLLVQSWQYFSSIVKSNYPLPYIDLKVVELYG